MALNFMPTPSFKAATLSDSTNELNARQGGRPGFDCVMATGAGNIVVVTDLGAVVTIAAAAGQTYNVRGVRVNSTLTTATGVLVGWYLPL